MKFKYIKQLLAFPIFLFWTAQVGAIEINSMFLVSDSKGEATFTIKNTNDKRIFMNVGMFEMQVVEGDIEKTPYTRHNIGDWKIDVRPAKTIIDPGQVKDFKVSLKCGRECSNEQDQIFQLAFVPTPYFSEGSIPEQAVQMAIGFGALFMNPVEDAPIRYKSTYQGSVVTIHNQGDSYLRATLNNCSAEVEEDERQYCTKKINVMAGRNLHVTLPPKMQKSYVDIYVETNLNRYSDTLRIKK